MRGIRFQLMYTYIFFILIAIAACGLYVMQFLERTYMDTVRDHLRQEAQVVALFMSPNFQQASSPTFIQAMEHLSNQMSEQVNLLNQQGKVLASSSMKMKTGTNMSKEREVIDAQHGFYGSNIRVDSVTGENTLYVAVPIQVGMNIEGYVQIAASIASIHDRIRPVWYWVAGGLLLSRRKRPSAL